MCGCRLLTDTGLAAAMTLLAPSLHSLNARGTDFGDEAAKAFAAAGGALRRLNASCTPLSGAGLAALSKAAPPHSLLVLDLCYTEVVGTADVLAVARRHPSLQMVGMGGFSDLDLGGAPRHSRHPRRCDPTLVHPTPPRTAMPRLASRTASHRPTSHRRLTRPRLTYRQASRSCSSGAPPPSTTWASEVVPRCRATRPSASSQSSCPASRPSARTSCTACTARASSSCSRAAHASAASTWPTAPT